MSEVIFRGKYFHKFVKCLRSFGSTIAVELHSKFGHPPFKCELCPATFEKYGQKEEHR